MSAHFRITLPDGSVREVAPGTTPADIAAAIGPGLAKAAIAARVDGELRDIGRAFEGDAQLALVTSRDEADALELARHDYAHVLAEAVQALFPGTQITFGPSTDDGFYYDFAPKDRPFTEEDLPAIEAKMREIIAQRRAAGPRGVEPCRPDRSLDQAGRDLQGRMGRRASRGRGADRLSRGHGRGRVARHVPRAAPRLDRQARSARVQADARVGRILARRPEERDAQPHLRHRLAQPEAARRASDDARGSGQTRPPQDRAGDGPVPSPVGGAGLGLLASQRLHPVAPDGGIHAPPARRRRLCRGEDAAADGRAAVGTVGPLGQVPRKHVRGARRSAQHGGRGRGAVGRGRPDGAEADELPGARADLQAGDQELPRPADPHGGVRLLPPE